MSLTPHPCILKINPYVQGLAELKTSGKVIKLSSNEAALGPSPKAIAAYSNHTPNLQRYCDGTAANLRKAIGKVYRLDPERIVCGAGSDELIALLIHAYAGEGDEVLYSQYGFRMYAISALKVGAVPVKAPEKNMQTDVDAVLALVTARTKIVFIANPNNPTGSYISTDEMIRLRKGLRDNILLVIDSAYAEFVKEPDFTAGKEIVDLGENTVMLRTFSKIYGLASLRLGWAYSPASITDILNRVRGPFNISGTALDAGIAAVTDVEFTEKARLHNNTWLEYMIGNLKKIGLKPFPSVANFVLVEFPLGAEKNAGKADAFLKNKGIICRQVGSYGLDHCLRFTVGLEDENKAVIEALTEFMGA